MEETIAELRRQLEEERQAREDAEARVQPELRRQLEEERQAREDAEARVQPTTLFGLLDRCHISLSQAIRVETDATLTTQGDATDPVNRLYPKRIIPWLDFPQLQEKIWKKFDRMGTFATQPIFPSNEQLDYVATNIQNRPIYSEASLRNFERESVDNFVEKIIEALRDNEILRHEFDIQGRVTFYDRAETSLENSVKQMTLQNTRSPQRPANTRHNRRATQNQTRPRTPRKRNRRADQFCVHTVANEQKKPVYAVEFKAPHKLTIPELVAGLHEIDLARDVIDQEGDTFEYHATRLVSAVVTQIFSYMIDSGLQDGYICTGEAFVFLHIPEDPTVIQYYLCVPNQDVQGNDQCRLHRTAIGQVLAFTLQALAAEAPSQEWHDTAHDELTTWKVEYLDILREIPETVRSQGRPTSIYRPSHWKLEPKIHNTRSRARCQPGISTPKHSSAEGSGSEEESYSPSTAAAARSQASHQKSSRSRSNKQQSDRRHGRTEAGQNSEKNNQVTRAYCSIDCIRGIVNRDTLDKKCPNLQSHLQHSSSHRHSMGSAEFSRRLHRQLVRNRNEGFEQLHVRGRTGYLVKATLLTHGYTVVIKATTAEKQHRLQAEVENYRHLTSLQGRQIPVCLGAFKPRIAYWYHGEMMAHMMILGWSGMRLQHVVNDQNSSFFDQKRKKALAVLRSHGIIHCDSEWRNMLWDHIGHHLVVVDLEDVKWLKRPCAVEPAPGNIHHIHRARDEKNRPKFLSSSASVCT
ncbi:hypothetical protein N7457_001584 [Penicillium paradoxum]|uniref:uncharacterized protein n=1 Tax=Penicillium paradoxum TaxID=176176 RepID=UPI002546ADCC|nr:uncharacterized protein N7457_001584 [Penicillium paradoxum]KAJ5794985.1 hypothetical protein N7457_001584 [Penicillium paradoxum]